MVSASPLYDLGRHRSVKLGAGLMVWQYPGYKLTTPSGDVVRVAPNTLSFVTPQAYRDIYGHATQGKRKFLKNSWYQQDEPRITNVRDPAAHAEQRKALSHAFSARALRNQETIINEYVNQLLEQISKLGADGKKNVNITDIWNWLTFDVIGESNYNYTYPWPKCCHYLPWHLPIHSILFDLY